MSQKIIRGTMKMSTRPSRDVKAAVSTSVFLVRVNGGPILELHSKSGICQEAVAAIPAMFGCKTPCDVEIWSPKFLPEYGPYFYRIYYDECVRFRIDQMFKRS